MKVFICCEDLAVKKKTKRFVTNQNVYFFNFFGHMSTSTFTKVGVRIDPLHQGGEYDLLVEVVEPQ
jgi:hypothetical protein